MSMQSLEGKTVLVAGASRSLGRHIARKFAEAGANLVLPWFDWPDSVTEMVEEFSQRGYDFLDEQCDLRKLDEVRCLAEKACEKFGSISYLINNIERGGMPIVHGSYALPHNKEQWQLEVDSTLKAKWNLYTCFKNLLQNSSGGAVVNISSIAGETGRSGPGAFFFNDAYAAANRAIRLFTETWARECAPDVRVNEVVLGLIESRHGPRTRGWETMTAEQREMLQQRPLLERFGTEQEVADLVWFLAVEASYMTGSVVAMDGGYQLGGDRVPSYPPGIL